MPTIDPPQPAGGEYPLSALVPSTIEVFTNHEDYKTKTGKDAPVFNAQLPVKAWIDTSVKQGSSFQLLTYNTAHLDPSGQKPIVTTISVPGFLASTVNLPLDSGPGSNPATVGTFLTPIRALLPNEQLNPREGGQIDVINTDIFNPNAPAPTLGGFTDADRAQAAATFALIGKIAAAVGVSA